MQKLCNMIGMPQEVTARMLALDADPAFRPDCEKLTIEALWDEGLEELGKILDPDPNGFQMLCCMLRCALKVKQTFAERGLSEEIYYASMGCFSRFVREHYESFGCYGFDRAFWTVRQVSGMLFRIGELEYELIQWEGKPAISLHIPTDVRLQLPLLRESYLQARELLSRGFPEFADAPMVCHSWLLSPALEKLLPPESNILAFQRAFRITRVEDNSEDVVLWVFKNPNLKPEEYPENTSLQRRLKAYLLAGNVFCDAGGILRDDPFLPENE